ncbi:orcokinin peptides [Camponotus floridanus]|nr:orcokinin peptides [Camponotus floridanus]
MAFPSSIAIVFIGVTAYAVTAGPVQGISNTLQRDEYGSPPLADLLARYWEDRRMNQEMKQNANQIGDGYLVRDIDDQRRRLLGELTDRLTQHSDFANDEQILDAIGQGEISIDRYRDELLTDQLINRDVSNNAREDDGKKNLDQINNEHLVRNLDQIGGGHLVRNLDQIGGGHLVRNLDQIGGGHLVRNLDQIGGGHLVRNLDQIGGGHLVRNLDQIGGGHLVRNLDQIGGGHLVRNLDQIGGGHLVRNLDQIGGGHVLRNVDYSNAETKRSADQPAVVLRKLQLARNLERIKNDNLLRNME